MNISDYYFARTQPLSGGAAPGTAKGSGSESFVDSMAELIAQQKSGGTAAVIATEQEREMLLQRLKDPSGDFFRDLKLAAIRAAREKQEEEEEQEAIDALMQIIDNVTGKAQADRQFQSDWAGVRLGMLEDNDPRTPTSLQMLAYLASLGDKGTFQVGEDEEQEAEIRKKVQQNIDSRTAVVLQRTEGDELYAGSAERTVLSDGDIAALAAKYDPRHMSREEYDAFLDELVEMGALSRDETKHLGYNGAVMFLGANAFGGTVSYYSAAAVVEDLNQYEPSYGWIGFQVPTDSDILSWMDQRMLWRVAIVGGDPDIRQEYAKQENEALSTLSGILGRMEKARASL